MTNLQHLERAVSAYERAAVQKRLAQISIALGQLSMRADQAASLIRERISLRFLLGSCAPER